MRIAAIAALRAVHLVGHNSFNATPEVVACRFDEKRCSRFGDNLMRFAISLVISRASLYKADEFPSSILKAKFKECAQQWTGIATGCSLLIVVAILHFSCPAY